MLTVTALAKHCNVSRTTVLYYERAGLLQPAQRADNGYRYYGDKEIKRLESILSYRSFGIPVEDIAPLLDSQCEQSQQQLLTDQFNALESEIQRLRKQQSAIVATLNQPSLLTSGMLTKEKWTALLAASGMSEEDMTNWHIQFEKMEPQAHQQFLESLGIDTDEIERIRQLS
ncbi:MerR family DNA-binding transcriptional regulator [Photobacterium sanctipauli]|uniref:MerR family DNA-binding transcriptional regulator n=1 Tax=Photobacterium sanctipauli TaxID=1342794 RepID=A0A2T3NPC4_9GAMM|nr:MerR family transcriptional regulator [Photobacterium sanctipauli]PSW18098.1 MerR family DNA-binding transcriptional regulator [Photobacterium sanctipauli]